MSNGIKAFAKMCITKVLCLFPLRNIIMFESKPDCVGNTKPVFDELVRRGYNRKYRMIWRLNDTSSKDHEKIHNVRYIREGRRLYLNYYYAKLFISENSYFNKTRKNGQYMIHLTHGGALKNVTRHYSVPDYVDEIVTFSRYLLEADAKNNGFPVERISPIGYPRNDVLLGEGRDLHPLFPGRDFNKVIYWLPTYRQHNRLKGNVFSEISIPVIYNPDNARLVNDIAKENKVLIVVKPHFAQDVSLITALEMSNIVFINDGFLRNHGLLNYDLLCSSDALLTDYSSVYYDFLLKNRPIGLCWEDFEDYREREGFAVDIDKIMAGGEKILSAEDLCSFIKRIGAGEDVLGEQRNAVRDLIFEDPCQRSTERVTDRIVEILKGL